MTHPKSDRWEELIASAPGRRGFVLGRYVLAAFSPFSLLILAMLLIGGPEQQSGGSMIRVDLLFFTYSAGAFVAGNIVGLFLPATRYAWSALLVGMVALFPWAVGIGATFDHGYSHWTSAHTFTTAVTTIILGAGFGYGFFVASTPKRQPRRVARKHGDHAA